MIKTAKSRHGNKCAICGYDRCLEALDFHHVDSETKLFNISNGETRDWSKTVTELNKCILICSNCHREVHNGITTISNIERIIIEHPEEDINNTAILCNKCGVEITQYSSSGMCSVCSNISRRKVDRPCKEELIDLLENNSFLGIGKIYGVSDNSIRKWCKAYEIPHTKAKLKIFIDNLKK